MRGLGALLDVLWDELMRVFLYAVIAWERKVGPVLGRYEEPPTRQQVDSPAKRRARQGWIHEDWLDGNGKCTVFL